MAKINKYEIILDEWHATELARMAKLEDCDDDNKYLNDIIIKIIETKEFNWRDYTDQSTTEALNEFYGACELIAED